MMAMSPAHISAKRKMSVQTTASRPPRVTKSTKMLVPIAIPTTKGTPSSRSSRKPITRIWAIM